MIGVDGHVGVAGERSVVLLKLLLLFITVPLVELALLLMLGDATDSWMIPLLVVVVTGVLGAVLARRQGFLAMQRVRQQLDEGRLPADPLLDALLIFMAGALLLTPGMLTDALGFSLLLPLTRRWYKAWLVAWFKRHFQLQVMGDDQVTSSSGSVIIDSYVVERPEADERGNRNES